MDFIQILTEASIFEKVVPYRDKYPLPLRIEM